MKNPQALCYNKFRLRTEDFFSVLRARKIRNMCWKTGEFYMEKRKKHEITDESHHFFFIIILVPIVMCALTFYFFVGYKTKSIGEKYGLANATYRTLSNNTLLFECDDSRRVRRGGEDRKIGYLDAGRNGLSRHSECETEEKNSRLLRCVKTEPSFTTDRQSCRRRNWKMSCRNTAIQAPIPKAVFISK